MMRVFIRGFGEFCMTVGAILLLFLAYLTWGTAWQASSAQRGPSG